MSWRKGLGIAVLLVITSCGGVQDEAPDRLHELFTGGLEVVDLTHALSASTPYWPAAAGSPFKYEVVAAHPDGATMMGSYSTPEHHGTHLDAPVHGGEGLASVDELSAAELFGPAVVIDVAAAAAVDPDYTVSPADIDRWEAEHGRIPDGAIVLMASGWSRKYGDQAEYANQDADGAMHFPGFSLQAATFLVEERNIRAIGVDTLSVDAATAAGFPAHGAVNGAGKYHLENVANVHLLPAAGAYLIVAPIKIAAGSGGQVRIFAVLPGASG